MKTYQHQDEADVLTWDTDYDGSAIYALVDDNGKCYVGQSKHLQARLKTHRKCFQAILNGNTNTGEGAKITEAVLSGVKFHAKVLKAFPEVYETSRNNLARWERHFFDKLGGLDGTYNSTYAMSVNSYYEPFNKEITWEEYKETEHLHKRKQTRPHIGRDLIPLWWYAEEQDLATHLESVPDKQEYIKKLIRQDMERRGN